MNSNTRTRIVQLAVVLFCGCSPALYIPSATDASRTEISIDSLQTGRVLYITHCGSCHNLHLPEQYTGKHWEQKMPEMQRKAKILDSEAKLISSFLLARSKVK